MDATFNDVFMEAAALIVLLIRHESYSDRDLHFSTFLMRYFISRIRFSRPLSCRERERENHSTFQKPEHYFALAFLMNNKFAKANREEGPR